MLDRDAGRTARGAQARRASSIPPVAGTPSAAGAAPKVAVSGAAREAASGAVAVWDGFVRVFHWLLVISVAIAATTGFVLGAPWLRVHLAAGLVAGGLVVLRLIWGAAGSAPARFSSFLASPRAVLGYTRRRLRGTAERYLTHNPLGALMVVAVIAGVLLLAATGLVGLGGALRTGPLASGIDVATGEAALVLHWWLAAGLLALVALHVAAVLHEVLVERDPLIAAMITGRKPASARDLPLPAPTRPRWAALAVGAAGLAALGGLAVSLGGRLPVPGQPVAEIDALVAEECGACHLVYHPSMLPAARWQDIMATLEDHFGEDASLDEESAAAIAEWLTAHAAETAQTRPAHGFADIAPGQRLEETAFWKARHRRLDPALFKSPQVGSAANCKACHRDAETGRFSPFMIELPKETRK
ncbi:MAG: cytochrome B [Alphaproteobacteria bacterium]|nr:MAG: cytochrome B [Alphaproteobacteria bacterium]